MRIKTILASLLGVAALMLGRPALAHADDASFLEDMEAAGFYNDGGNGAEIAVGHDICRELANGWTSAQAVRDLWMTGKMDEDGATQFVSIAIKDLCPAYGGSSGANS